MSKFAIRNYAAALRGERAVYFAKNGFDLGAGLVDEKDENMRVFKTRRAADKFCEEITGAGFDNFRVSEIII